VRLEVRRPGRGDAVQGVVVHVRAESESAGLSASWVQERPKLVVNPRGAHRPSLRETGTGLGQACRGLAKLGREPVGRDDDVDCLGHRRALTVGRLPPWLRRDESSRNHVVSELRRAFMRAARVRAA
jgi:hypothetical protein